MTISIFIIIFTVLSYYLAKYLNNDIGILPLHKQIEQSTTRHHSEVKNINYLNYEIYYTINEENIFSGKVSYVTLAIKSSSNEKFIIEKMGWIMRLFIWLKLMKSSLVIHENIALFSDEETTRMIFEERNIQHLLISIFNEPFLYDTKKIILSNQDNEFSIKLKLNKTHKLKEVKIEKFIDIYADKFVNIYEEINFKKLEEKVVIEHEKSLNSSRFGLVFLGVWGFFLSLIEGYQLYPSILDHTSLLWLSFKLSLGFSLLVAIFILKKINHSIFKFDIASKFFLFSIVTFFAISLLSIKYSNIFLDDSQTFTLVKMIKSKKKSFKGTPRYYFHCKDGTKITINLTLYNSKKEGDVIYLSTKKGYWGLEWISDVK